VLKALSKNFVPHFPSLVGQSCGGLAFCPGGEVIHLVVNVCESLSENSSAFCDSLESLSVDTNVCESLSAFCDSLESLSVDTNVSPVESFLQLLENDSHTLLDLDSGAIQVMEPPECDFDDLSFLQDISSDEWTDLLEDVEDFDVEELVPPEGIVDLLEDMTPDEGIDLMYDLVT